MTKKKLSKKKKTIPKSKTVDENEFLRVIDIISKKLAYKFKFGYHDIEDMKQQITVFALEGIKNYDHKRPLENFLWTHVRNRLFNYKRDNYQRPDKPCYACPLYDPHRLKSHSQCSEHSDKNSCELYSQWTKRNDVKKNLMHLTTIDEIKSYSSAFISDDDQLVLDITNQEIISILEQNLIDEYRTIYLKLKSGSKVSKSDTEKLTEKIKQILKDHNG